MRYRVVATAICLMGFVPAGAFADGCARTYRLGWTEIPPAFHEAEDGSVTGVDIELARVVFADAGCAFEAKKMPFKRYVEGLRFGNVDVVASSSYSEERATYARFSRAYRRERMVLFIRRDNPATYESFEALAQSGALLTAGLGMWLGPQFAALYEGDPAFRDRVFLLDGYPKMLRAVVAGRVDGVIGDSNGVRYLIHEGGLDSQIRATSLTVHDNNVHFMFSRKTVPLADVERIDAALARFVGTPAHIEMLERYQLGDVEAQLPREEKRPRK